MSFRLPQLVILLVSSSLTGVIWADENEPLASALAPLAGLIGEWVAPADDPLLAKRPEYANMVAYDHEWGPRQGTMRMWEGVPAGDRSRAVLEGTIAWDPVAEAIRFVAANTAAGLFFQGTYRVLEGGAIERVFDVHYPQDPAGLPEPELPGRTRRFREVLYPDGEDAFDATLDIWKGGEFVPWGQAGGKYRIVRRGSAAASGGPAAYARLSWLIGEWQGTFSPEGPEGLPPKMSFSWGEQQTYIRSVGWRPKDGALIPEYEGTIVWHGELEKLMLQSVYTSSSELVSETGEVVLLPGGAVRLDMQVHYAEGVTLPWSGGAVAGPGGHTLEFRRTLTPEGSDGLLDTFLIKMGPHWREPAYKVDLPEGPFRWQRAPAG